MAPTAGLPDQLAEPALAYCDAGGTDVELCLGRDHIGDTGTGHRRDHAARSVIGTPCAACKPEAIRVQP